MTKSDKVLTVIVTLAIIAFIIINMLPEVSRTVSEVKGEYENIKGNYITSNINTYIKNHSDYYFAYEGATYCIPISNLVGEGLLSEGDVDMTSIIEASYNNGVYTYQYNNDCIEK